MDGCAGGWVAVLHPGYRVVLCSTFVEVLALDAVAVAVDIPIGLLDEPVPGGRECDRAARRLLGRRASSVFSPPARTFLCARTFSEVRGLTLQGFYLLPRIREVDRLMTPELQGRVRESHPEVVFARLGEGPCRSSKHTPEGLRERLERLGPEAAGRLQGAAADLPRSRVALHDLADAFALVRAARHMLQGNARTLPESPPRDSRGLRMEIVAGNLAGSGEG